MSKMPRMLVVIAALLCSDPAVAQLKPYVDYETSDSVWHITTVKVHANATDDYLEGIRQTWVASQNVAKELGQIEDYFVYASDLPGSGDFNMLLVTKFKSSADVAPSKARYEAFMKEWGDARVQKTRAIVKDYPAMREITGEYQLRRVMFK